MTCQEMDERLDDYVDGVLAAVDARAVEAHLASCAACREAEQQDAPAARARRGPAARGGAAARPVARHRANDRARVGASPASSSGASR